LRDDFGEGHVFEGAGLGVEPRADDDVFAEGGGIFAGFAEGGLDVEDAHAFEGAGGLESDGLGGATPDESGGFEVEEGIVDEAGGTFQAWAASSVAAGLAVVNRRATSSCLHGERASR
jgi:hypothetical protein